MVNPFILKLEHGADLTDDDRRILEAICAEPRPVEAHRDLIREGDRPEDVHLVMGGIAGRYKILPDGGRQIMALLLPGDLCDLQVSLLGEMDHSIATLSPCSLVYIPRVTVDEITAGHPRISRALWWSTLVDEAILREWIVSMGQRPADQQMAHLFCELLIRLQNVGLADETDYQLPLTQEQIGDTLGMSTVHVNRTLQGLRQQGLIAMRGASVTILDVERLQDFSGFNPNYLHLTKRKERGQAEQRRTTGGTTHERGADAQAERANAPGARTLMR